MAIPKLCETVGLEVEVENIPRRYIPNISGFQITHDASVESDTLMLGKIPVKADKELKLSLPRDVLGAELVSGIIDTNDGDYLATIKYLTSTLISMGESYESNRAGLHVHLSFGGTNLEILKSVIKLGLHLEDVFFLLGGMGYEFRGKVNDSTYCRPISKFGPPVVKTSKGKVQVINVDDLLSSKTVEEFKERCGDLMLLGGNRYIPVRYLWLNLFNIWNNKQTLEFRVFNKTLNPMYIYAIIEICKAFGYNAVKASFNAENKFLQENSVYNYREKDEIINTFINWAEGAVLQSHIIDTAIQIMNKVPIESIRFQRRYFYSHLAFHRGGNRIPDHWGRSKYNPNIINERVYEPKFLDIHNLRAEGGNNEPPFLAQPVRTGADFGNNVINVLERERMRLYTNNRHRMLIIPNFRHFFLSYVASLNTRILSNDDREFLAINGIQNFPNLENPAEIGRERRTWTGTVTTNTTADWRP